MKLSKFVLSILAISLLLTAFSADAEPLTQISLDGDVTTCSENHQVSGTTFRNVDYWIFKSYPNQAYELTDIYIREHLGALSPQQYICTRISIVDQQYVYYRAGNYFHSSLLSEFLNNLSTSSTCLNGTSLGASGGTINVGYTINPASPAPQAYLNSVQSNPLELRALLSPGIQDLNAFVPLSDISEVNVIPNSQLNNFTAGRATGIQVDLPMTQLTGLLSNIPDVDLTVGLTAEQFENFQQAYLAQLPSDSYELADPFVLADLSEPFPYYVIGNFGYIYLVNRLTGFIIVLEFGWANEDSQAIGMTLDIKVIAPEIVNDSGQIFFFAAGMGGNSNTIESGWTRVNGWEAEGYKLELLERSPEILASLEEEMRVIAASQYMLTEENQGIRWRSEYRWEPTCNVTDFPLPNFEPGWSQ